MCKTYIVNKENKRFEYNDWKEKYTNFLIKYYKNEKCESVYNDPDSVRHKEFYEDLTIFLNAREEEKLKGKWSYEFDLNNDGIKVKDKDDKWLFTIFSDQFGFSAPNNNKDKKYPYDIYAIISDYNKATLEEIADYIYFARTIGGSFLWPIDGGKGYNKRRGGKKTSKGYYIEDRVDLTLLEIKNYYEGNNNSIYLKNYLSNDMKEWFDHFGTFEIYVDFFILNSFVDKNYMPIPLVKNSKDIDLLNGKEWTRIMQERDITDNKYKQELKKALKTLIGMIKIRTNKIEEIIKKYRDKNESK